MVVAKGRTERDVARGPGGFKAGAGLRGPYGTSVRHTWPTWILLIPTVTFISTLPFFSLSFPPFAPIFSKKFSFLDLTRYISIHMRSVLFSFHTPISGLPVFCLLFPISIVNHLENSRFFFLYILSFKHTLFTIVNIFPIFQSYPWYCINATTFAHLRMCLYIQQAYPSSSRSGRESAFQFYYPSEVRSR